MLALTMILKLLNGSALQDSMKKKNFLLVVILEEARALGVRDFSVFMGNCCCISVLQLLQHTREALPQHLLSLVQSFEQDLMLG